jgi:hypothetical protein
MSRSPNRAAPPAPRAAYLVLGMHRSGTSAVTQLLALAGAMLPAHVMPGDENNEKGYFEPWKIAIFNDERLRAGASAWDDVFAYPYRALPPDEEQAWRVRAAELFAEEYGGVAWPLMKDPRATVLLPFWRSVLDGLSIRVRCVIPVRHPLAVAGSLARRDGFTPQKSVLVWTAYMLAAEAYTRDLPRAFVGYDALLADWRAEARRIEAAHGAPLPKLTEAAGKRIDRFLTPSLRHNAGDGALEALGWTGRLAAEVLAWFKAAATGLAPDRRPLEAATADLTARRAEYGPLISPATRDLDIARAAREELAHTRRELEEGWRADVRGWEIKLGLERRRLVQLAQQVSTELDAVLEDD